MSDEAERTPGLTDALAGSGRLWTWIAVPVVGLVVLLLVMIVRTPVGPKNPVGPSREKRINELAIAREALGKSTDLATCRAAIERLNAHLAQEPKHRPTPLTAEQRNTLRSLLSLDEGDLSELTSNEFTLLDAHHLETCFLLRDAAASLEVVAPAGKDGKPSRLTGPERAEAAFAWTCRQVRLVPGEGPPAPPAFVLRRGWGTALERGLVFLAMLEQAAAREGESASLQGCLLSLPAAGTETRHWGCGVAVGDKPDGLLLFDTRMGLPLPGPDGKGIATLAQAQKIPAVLEQLKAGERSYDSTAKDASRVQVFAVCPLSAASTRMRLLQDVLLREREWNGKPLPSPILGRMAEDAPMALARIEAAVKAGDGKAEVVRYKPELASLARHSLTRAEGGIDHGVQFALRLLPGFTRPDDPETRLLPRSKLLELASVPWQAFPAQISQDPGLRFDTGAGAALRSVFAAPFTKAFRDPTSAREAVLRGRVDDTVSQRLVREREHWLQARQRNVEPAVLRRGLDAWVVKAKEADEALARAANSGGDVQAAQEALSKLLLLKPGEPLETVMTMSMAGPRGADVTYLLGLCLHERASAMQTRYALAAKAGVDLPDELKRAREAWEGAEFWWNRVLVDFPGDPSSATARRLRGEAVRNAGETEQAKKVWSSADGTGTPLERLGDAWLARP